MLVKCAWMICKSCLYDDICMYIIFSIDMMIYSYDLDCYLFGCGLSKFCGLWSSESVEQFGYTHTGHHFFYILNIFMI